MNRLSRIPLASRPSLPQLLQFVDHSLVVPIDRVKIVATANLGDRYTGLDLGDPAFRRRWTGGWLHLGAYAPDTVGEILADKLKLPPTAALITRMKAVSTQIEQFQRSEDKLIATLDLATLIAWGQTAIELAGTPGMSVARAFATVSFGWAIAFTALLRRQK